MSRGSPPPRWFGSKTPWREPSDPRAQRRRRVSVRRHAAPAFLAIVAASGIGLAWTGDLHLTTTERSGVAAEATAAPTPGPTVTPASASTPTPAVAATVAPSTTVAEAISPSPSVDGAVTLGTVVDLPSNPDRRRAQTWEAPPDPSRLDGYRWPLPKGFITDPFGPSRWGSSLVGGQSFHDGVDVASFCGDHIVAAHDGVVLAAGRRFDDQIGWVGDLSAYYARLDAKKLWWTLPMTVVIDDGNGYRSIYAHFYQLTVKVGQRVKAGQMLGYEGATGRATGCHLHYGLFAPHESATFGIEPSVVEHLLVPAFQIARIDPLRVLPKRPGDEEPTTIARPDAGHDRGG